MLKILLFCSFLLFNCFTYAQETVKKSNQIGYEISEKFSVLKSDKKVRQGEYIALTSKNIIVAKGNYQNGKRAGNWQFFNFKGVLTQTYNYDNNTVNVIDTNETKDLKYYYANNIEETDTVSKPVKIGGLFYGLFTVLFDQPALSQTIRKDYADYLSIGKFDCKHILTVNGKGELIKHEVVVTGNGADKLYILDDSKFDEELKRFVPAMINNRPVESKIITTANISYSSSR